MADPFSIAASIISVVTPALHGIRLLIEDIKNIRDAPSALEALNVDLQLVDLTLKSLQDIKDAQWNFLGEVVVSHAKATIGSCSTVCSRFRVELHHWTKRSKNGELSWLDRGNIGFLKQSEIKSMSRQLQNCHVTISSMVSTATLHSSIRNTQMSQEIEGMLSARRGEIASSITATDERLAEAESTLDDLEHPDRPNQQGAADVLERIREEQQALQASRQLLQDLLAKTQKVVARKTDRKGQRFEVHNTFGNDNHGFQMGVNEGTISNIRFGA